MSDKVVLAYSGGLDTSVAIKWLKDNHNLDVIAVNINVGNERDFSAVRQKALDVGAVKSLVIDAQDMFVKYFVFPALQANALYQGQYPLATALSRPLMAKLLVDTAVEEDAVAIVHGCTSKGNDQVRFDVGINTLAPDLKIMAPARSWGMTREETIAYAKKHGIPVPITVSSPYSIDENLWGRSIECGVLEDPWNEPPDDVYTMTTDPAKAAARPQYVEIEFEKGVPVALDGQRLEGVALVKKLNEIAGSHGVGRIDHIEDRVVGIKSREIYEAPAAVVLVQAHKALESMTMSRAQLLFKQKVDVEYSELIYNGLWFSQLNRDLAAYIMSSQRYVTGTIRIKLYRGNSAVVGRKALKSLYHVGLATYDKGDQYDHSAAEGFIYLWGLPVRTQAQIQLLDDKDGPLSIMGSENS